MRYRQFGNSNLKVSEIGIGCEHLQGKNEQTVRRVIGAALDGGINILDCFMPEPEVRTNIGRAIHGKREKVMIQGHLRTVWKNGQYGRSLNLHEVQASFEDLLRRLDTDYIDFGMIHMVDNEADFDRIFNGEIMQYACSLRERGIIHKLGISSHNSAIALRAVKTGLLDSLMLSINPAYDMLRTDKLLLHPTEHDLGSGTAQGIEPVRAQLYATCENMGVGITSMKTLCAGLLLQNDTSPFRRALTPYQCFRYALTRPAVASVMIGMQTEAEVAHALGYASASPEETDYSSVLSQVPSFGAAGACVYCNHCLPCPAHLDIAQINKYLDLALLNDNVPATIQAHYDSLPHKASACIGCGACERSCPFHVSVIQRMQSAANLFEMK